MTDPTYNNHRPCGRISHEFARLSRLCRSEQVPLSALFGALLSKRGPLPILILALPFIIPIPAPGLSTPFGVLIVLLAFSILFNRPLRLPQRLNSITAPGKLCRRIFSFCARASRWIDRISRPRLIQVVQHSILQKVCILIVILGGAVLALPLPPGTNWPPGGMIALLSVGMLRTDALFVLAGLIAAAFNVLFFGGLIWFADSSWQMVVEYLAGPGPK